jgi:hypothetical protein
VAFDSVVLTAPMPDSFSSAVQRLALRLPAIETRWGLQCVVHADVIVCACLVQPTSFFCCQLPTHSQIVVAVLQYFGFTLLTMGRARWEHMMLQFCIIVPRWVVKRLRSTEQ